MNDSPISSRLCPHKDTMLRECCLSIHFLGRSAANHVAQGWTFVKANFASRLEYRTSKARANLADSSVPNCFLVFSSFICLPSFWLNDLMPLCLERGRAGGQFPSAGKVFPLGADSDLLPSADLHFPPSSWVGGFTYTQLCGVSADIPESLSASSLNFVFPSDVM